MVIFNSPWGWRGEVKGEEILGSIVAVEDFFV